MIKRIIMSKIDKPKCFSKGGVVPKFSPTGRSLQKGIPYHFISSSFLNSLPFYEEWCKKITEMERRKAMNEKYCIFASGDFESVENFIKDKIKEYREKNDTKNSILFNMDYKKVEESINALLANKETRDIFERNMKEIFKDPFRTKKNDVFGEYMWNIRKEVIDKKEKEKSNENAPRLIFEYIRKKKRGIVGILIGYKPAENSDFYVGYSLCNPKDKFDLFTAFQLAFHSMFRVQTYKNTPQSIKGQKRSFICRCAAYFKTARGGFMYTTYKDKFWVDFCSCIPAEVRKNLEASPLDYKHFVLTPKKKEEDVINVMYANRVDVENVFDEETYYLDRNKRDFMYKNIRFGGCTHEKPSGRSIKITWEFVD